MEKVTKPKLFLETIIFNFYNYGKAQEKQRYTRKLFEAIAAGKYEPYTSTAVVAELLRDAKEKGKGRTRLIDEYSVLVLENTVETERLALLYTERGIILQNIPMMPGI
jgi:predicted nucleic acid-binding protein